MLRLTTKRLIIRDPLSSDIDSWHRLLSDAKTMYYLPDIMTRSLKESRRNLEDAVADTQNPDRTKYFLAVEDKKTGTFIGTIGYTVTQATPVGKLAHIGYFILPEYHGRGYVTEALREVIRFAFEDGGVYRVETGCISENRASERVMQKCGLIKEAERKVCVWHDGRLKDRVEYRLLRDEWLSGGGKFSIEPVSGENREVVDNQIAESRSGPFLAAHGVLHDTREYRSFVMNVTVRTMTVNDYEQVYALWLSISGLGLNNRDDSKDGISKYLARNPNTCFVAEKDGNIIGVILSGHDGRRGFIHHTAVNESEQRRGVGTALVNAAMTALEREGINKAALVVFGKNEKGGAFWEKQGFCARDDLIYRNKAIADLTRIDT